MELFTTYQSGDWTITIKTNILNFFSEQKPYQPVFSVYLISKKNFLIQCWILHSRQKSLKFKVNDTITNFCWFCILSVIPKKVGFWYEIRFPFSYLQNKSWLDIVKRYPLICNIHAFYFLRFWFCSVKFFKRECMYLGDIETCLQKNQATSLSHSKK